MYEHNILGQQNVNVNKFNEPAFDINLPILNQQIYATNFQNGPRLPYEHWHGLPDDAKKIWDMLRTKARMIILQPF